ncbi:hypothetical protein P175DRAFT_0557533 [Aspergillus ochraceoroseus IBT 24754]|uniref:Uncharacterized protein n=1 Tax=Aspergillus ochraceoroseus IBT 24754 TaxID=1392256 RepID=A0A2T5LX29_9EURO|nr:uncharacterized protein P175DRAFT_0557533 [Aspergillus ochraceoroseus IBT 24754]PTU20842.1 hypothetical protein P175DRAFT_0557533 [Aspergillus ochraceoroseus IBT 24754]
MAKTRHGRFPEYTNESLSPSSLDQFAPSRLAATSLRGYPCTGQITTHILFARLLAQGLLNVYSDLRQRLEIQGLSTGLKFNHRFSLMNAPPERRPATVLGRKTEWDLHCISQSEHEMFFMILELLRVGIMELPCYTILKPETIGRDAWVDLIQSWITDLWRDRFQLW